MARIRSVKPEFFTSLSVAELSIPARLTFIGLWTHVDDDGRCEDEPRLIKGALWPLDDDMTAPAVDAVLAELADHGKIVRYTVGGRRYLVVQGWDHQKIDRKKDSKHPSPDDADPPCEPSPTDRRHVADASSPDLDLDLDLDRIGTAPRARLVEPSSFVEMAEPNGAIALRRDCTEVLSRADSMTTDPLLAKERSTLRPVVEEALGLGYDPDAIAQAVAFAPFRTMAGVMGELRKAKQQPTSVGNRGLAPAAAWVAQEDQ